MSPAHGIFLLGFGAPASLESDDLVCFLEGVTGRTPPPQAVEGLRRRYNSIGGRSPLLEISISQSQLLAKNLRQKAGNVGVYFGMRCGSPSIRDAVEKARKDGVTKAVAITQAPQYSIKTLPAYKEALQNAIADSGAKIEVTFVDSYGTHAGFIAAVCSRLRELIDASPDLDISQTPLLCSAHSLPGEPSELQSYVDELNAGAKLIAEKMKPARHVIGFQSPGRGGGKWLEPSVEKVMEALYKDGARSVIVCPIGFICENLETKFDLDIECAKFAESLGMKFYRCKTVSDSPILIEAWSDIATEKLGLKT